jgi:3-deoxy-7-phosphoheptulonate synthase
MPDITNDFRVASERLLFKPDALISALPLAPELASIIQTARAITADIIHGRDDRLLVVVGPCSIHDENAALEYAELLKAAATRFADELFIVMRLYFEKPRTLLGWKGLISDPWLDNSYDINHGLQLARKILLQTTRIGMSAATEFLDNITPRYLSDLITWNAVGARTSESQLHRELTSGLVMPAGFKNSTDGNIQIAVDGVNAARSAHCFLGIADNGEPAIVRTQGNENCHIILRGSNTGVNYTASDVNNAVALLENAELPKRVMIDCSHGNSMKDFRRQHVVVADIVEQLRQGSPTILGVMLESNLVAGKQAFDSGQPLVYGQSITDACISWEETLPLLEQLALAKG